MGYTFSILDWAFGSGKKASILILGLDASGKTTLLYRFKTNETDATVPTIGFNVEEIKYGNLSFTCFDIGGQDKIRKLWHNYYKGADAVVFVVDSNDKNRFPEVKKELHTLMNHPLLKQIPFLIFANKQDLPNSVDVSTLKTSLDLWKMYTTYRICETTATEGLGIEEGFQWLSDTL